MNRDPDQATDILQMVSQADASKKFWKKSGLVILLAAAVGVAWYFFRPPDQVGASVMFQTAESMVDDLVVLVSATGSLEPVDEVDVGSELSGTIKKVKVDFNDHVHEDQVLAVLDTTRLDAELVQSEAALKVAQAELLDAQAEAEKTRVDLARLNKAYKLSGGKMPSRQELDSAVADFKKAKAQVEVKKANISKAEGVVAANKSDLSKAYIRAPIEGMVLDRQVESGQTVAASLEAPVLFTLAKDLTRMHLIVSIDEADVGLVKDGQKARFVVDAYPDREYPAHIIQVRNAPQEEDGVVTYECLLAVDNTDLSLRPGMTATVDIVVQNREKALLVPNAALRFVPSLQIPPEAPREGPGGGFLAKLLPGPPRHERKKNTPGELRRPGSSAQVWTLTDGRPEPVFVVKGFTDGIKTEIVSGNLKPGQVVLVGESAKP